MITRLISVAIGASLLSLPYSLAVSPSEIPSDTPISHLVSSAKENLAKGNANDALTYFDVAVSRDPQNYLTRFQRGATYLSLGKNAQANRDFDEVLRIKPDFEGALLQRAKIKSRNADWKLAKDDYARAKKTDTQEYAQLEEAEGAAALAGDAEKEGNWEACVSLTGTAIMVASTDLRLRQIRSRCRFERGEVLEGTSDLAHILQISPSNIQPHLQISSMLFFSVGDTDKGIEQLRKCLRSDPDSKVCSRLFRTEKQIDKAIKQFENMKAKRQFNSAVKSLIGSAEDQGLLADIKEEVKNGRETGHIHQNAPNELYNRLIEETCECYTEMNNRKKATSYCEEALASNGQSLYGLIHKAHTQLDAEEFDAAINTLNTAKEAHQSSQRIADLLQKAHTLLKRSKTKDYYKVLGVSSDADDRTIKRAYRTMTKKYHPDKAVAQQESTKTTTTKEQAEKKMAEINEAYEVLRDPELRARFDRGDDPNNPEQQQGGPFHGSPFGQGAGGQQFFFRQGSGGGGGQQFKFQGGGGGGDGGGFQFPGGFNFPGF